jgi:hypothetical protein
MLIIIFHEVGQWDPSGIVVLPENGNESCLARDEL